MIKAQGEGEHRSASEYLAERPWMFEGIPAQSEFQAVISTYDMHGKAPFPASDVVAFKYETSTLDTGTKIVKITVMTKAADGRWTIYTGKGSIALSQTGYFMGGGGGVQPPAGGGDPGYTPQDRIVGPGTANPMAGSGGFPWRVVGGIAAVGAVAGLLWLALRGGKKKR
jgi:hypothetical protein